MGSRKQLMTLRMFRVLFFYNVLISRRREQALLNDDTASFQALLELENLQSDDNQMGGLVTENLEEKTRQLSAYFLSASKFKLEAEEPGTMAELSTRTAPNSPCML